MDMIGIGICYDYDMNIGMNMIWYWYKYAMKLIWYEYDMKLILNEYYMNFIWIWLWYGYDMNIKWIWYEYDYDMDMNIKWIYTVCTNQVNPGKSYDPLLMSLVKSTSISLDEGEEKDKRRIFKPWDNWDMDCVCAIQRVNGKDKRWKCLWKGWQVA